MNTRPPAVTDAVALLIDVADRGLVRGQVGTVVECLTENHFEVEFIDDNGRTYAELALPRDSLLVLHHRLTEAHFATTGDHRFTPLGTSPRGSQNLVARDSNGLDAFYGKWPGDETDEELAAALEKSK